MDSVQTKYVVKAIALKNHSKIEESSTKEMSIGVLVLGVKFFLVYNKSQTLLNDLILK